MNFKDSMRTFFARVCHDDAVVSKLCIANKNCFRPGVPSVLYDDVMLCGEGDRVVGETGTIVSLRGGTLIDLVRMIEKAFVEGRFSISGCGCVLLAFDGDEHEEEIAKISKMVFETRSAYDRRVVSSTFYAASGIVSDGGRKTVSISPKLSLLWAIDNIVSVSPIVYESVMSDEHTASLIRGVVASSPRGGRAVDAVEMMRKGGGSLFAPGSVDAFEAKESVLSSSGRLEERLGIIVKEKKDGTISVAVDYAKFKKSIAFVSAGKPYYDAVSSCDTGSIEEAIAMVAGDGRTAADIVVIGSAVPEYGKEMADVAKSVMEPWVDEEFIRGVYDDFVSRGAYARRDSDPIEAWRRWLESDRMKGYPVDMFDEKAAIEAAANEGMSPEAAKALLNMFRNQYLSKGERRKKWMPVWKNWIARESKTADGSVRKGADSGAMNLYFAAKMVSDTICDAIKKAGIDPDTVLSGQAKVKGIVPVRVPVPPSGRESVTMLQYEDPQRQHVAVSSTLERLALKPSSENQKERSA